MMQRHTNMAVVQIFHYSSGSS